MNANNVVFGWSIGAILCVAGASGAATPRPVEGPEADVRAVFQAKCTYCHGADVARPRAGFGYVLDLGRVAGNRAMIVPSRSAESELWAMIESGEMPPPDSPTGPLTASEKESIRAWIEAGAPVAAPSVVAADEAGEHPRTPASRLLRRLGKLHFLFLHFPIALAVVAGGIEAWSVWKRNPVTAPSARLCLHIAAVAVIPTVAFGWLLALGGPGAGSPNLLLFHRWLGTAAGAWVIATAILVEVNVRRIRPNPWVRVILFAGVLLVAVVGHLGGLLVHGDGFFDW